MTRDMRSFFLPAVLLLTTLSTALATEPPAAYGTLPSANQVAHQKMEFYGFMHFGVNTFTGKQWGLGSESEKVFNPTNFDADQIVRTAKEAGMTMLILTCKHHDGFCLWPSAFTEHSVKNSPWKDGKGDVVREVSDACHKYGIKFGVYLSPWDRNRADYGTPEYLVYYRNQLHELLTNYGPVAEAWFDGANGGTGYYGGANEKRTIPGDYYGFADLFKTVHELQPGAVIFASGPEAEFRWVGNERGTAPETSWCTINAPMTRQSMAHGDRNGTLWQPAESDTSIRAGWFYDPKQSDKSPQQLVDIYYNTVGHGACLILNLPPDTTGQLAAGSVSSLVGFHKILDETFKTDLAKEATLTASNVRGADAQFAAENVIAGKPDRYWSTDDKVTNPTLEFDFKTPVTFNVVRLREHLPLGQRIDSIGLDQWKDGQWVEFGSATSIGECRLVRGQPVTTDKVRLRVQAPVCPALSEVGFFAEPVSMQPASAQKSAGPQ